MISEPFTELKSVCEFPRYFILKRNLNILMCVFDVNGRNRFEAKSIGIGLKSHVNEVSVWNI